MATAIPSEAAVPISRAFRFMTPSDIRVRCRYSAARLAGRAKVAADLSVGARSFPKVDFGSGHALESSRIQNFKGHAKF
jgi:hypothetical protein